MALSSIYVEIVLKATAKQKRNKEKLHKNQEPLLRKEQRLFVVQENCAKHSLRPFPPQQNPCFCTMSNAQERKGIRQPRKPFCNGRYQVSATLDLHKKIGMLVKV